MNKRVIMGIGAGIAAFAAVTASAATLGGITTDDLGADASVVASCDTDGITVDYTTTYDTATQSYHVDGVVLTNVDVEGVLTPGSCLGQAVSISLWDGTQQVEESGTVSLEAGTTGQTVSFNPTVSAELVENIAVVISG